MLARCEPKHRPDRPRVLEAGWYVDCSAEGQRHHGTNTGDCHQPSAHPIVTGKRQQMAVQNGELLAEYPSDDQHRLDHEDQIGIVPDQLLDPSLKLSRPTISLKRSTQISARIHNNAGRVPHLSAKGQKRTSTVWISRVREKQLLAIDLVVADGFLTLRRTQPIDELLAVLLPHQRMLGGVYECDAILIEHALVPLDQHLQVAFVLKMGPRGAVGQHIAVAPGCRVEGGVHALRDRAVPRAVFILNIDPRILVPDHEFSHMGAGAVAARYEGC